MSLFANCRWRFLLLRFAFRVTNLSYFEIDFDVPGMPSLLATLNLGAPSFAYFFMVLDCLDCA